MKEYLNEATSFETIIDFLRFGITKAKKANLFLGHGTDNIWDEMVALIFGSLNISPDMDKSLLQARLSKSEKTLVLTNLYQRIEEKIPVPYLTHEAYFVGLPFYVDTRVLIPRSPIGELIENQFSPWIMEEKVHHILDLCTGSGCIAIALALAFQKAEVDASDLSKEALDVARINRDHYALQDRVHLIESNCWSQIPNKTYDLIVSNPPYVSDEEMTTLPKEYLHEPKLALRADHEGLAIVDQILSQAKHYLNDGGILVVEVGNSCETLIDAYPNIPFTWLDFEKGGAGVFLLTKEELDGYFADTQDTSKG